MAWAVFLREANWSRPNCKFSFNAKPKSGPQCFPHDFVDYAVSKGWAVKVPPPRRGEKQKG